MGKGGWGRGIGNRNGNGNRLLNHFLNFIFIPMECPKFKTYPVCTTAIYIEWAQPH
jgi:hypothetical protein